MCSRLPLSCTLAILIVDPTLADDKPSPLADADKKELTELLKDVLFNPTGAERVRVPVTVYSPWGGSHTIARTGWLVRGKEGAKDRVYFADGHTVVAPAEKDIKNLDFITECRERYPENAGPKDDREVFRQMRQAAAGGEDDPDLAIAAWLHKLGHDDVAGRALATARADAKGRERDGKGPTPRDVLRGELAWRAFSGLVHGYVNRADDEALAHGERLIFLYKDLTEKDGDYNQADHVVRELKRRKGAGTFGRPPAKGTPVGFATWDTPKKVAFLIGSLDEVDARQWSQPGGVDLASDWRVQALIEVGEAAVPALIDCVEADERLTRPVHFWRDFSRHRTVLSVREAALAAVMSILRVRVFEPGSTGDNFTGRGEETAKQTAAKLRKYWETYGKLPFDERMMKVLTDEKATPEAWREAAVNLATLGSKRTIGTTISSGRYYGRPDGPNPAVAKFSKPTTAEAILAAMDRDLAGLPTRKGGYPYDAKQIEAYYVGSLSELADKRIAPVLAERAGKAAAVPSRRAYASAAASLGESKPLDTLARDFEAAKLDIPNKKVENSILPSDPGPVDVSELIGLIEALSRARTTAADRALYALADSKHPYHSTVVRLARREGPVILMESNYSHPFWLALFRPALDDTTATGKVYRITGDQVSYRSERGVGSSSIPEELADPKSRRDQAEARVCDEAAARVSELLAGAPRFHILRNDRDEALTTTKLLLDRFKGRFRLADRRERDELGASPFSPLFLPDIRPQGKPATADDVKAGRAVFHLDGKGKVADQKLPAWVMLKSDLGSKHPPRGLVVQAEIGPGGAVRYGVIFRHAVCEVLAADVEGLEAVSDEGKK